MAVAVPVVLVVRLYLRILYVYHFTLITVLFYGNCFRWSSQSEHRHRRLTVLEDAQHGRVIQRQFLFKFAREQRRRRSIWLAASFTRCVKYLHLH